jgi:hypothetical protein
MNRTLIPLMAYLALPMGMVAQETIAPPAQMGKTDKLPFVQVDVAKKRVVVDCETIGCTAPLEFLCVVTGTNEHESILRTPAKPSHIHTGLLMIGMQQGEPVRFSGATNRWLPPVGPPVQISVEFQKDGKTVTLPAYKLLREIKLKTPMPPRTWIFVGSKVLDNGQYAADTSGYVVSVVNFDFSLIDVSGLVSSSNDTLQYEADADVAPPAGTKVQMILEPAGAPVVFANGRPPSTQQVTVDQVKLDRLRDQWKREVAGRAGDIKRAATEHYRVITELRAEQNRLIDEAERIGRMIEELERDYQNMTVPHPKDEMKKAEN